MRRQSPLKYAVAGVCIGITLIYFYSTRSPPALTDDFTRRKDAYATPSALPLRDKVAQPPSRKKKVFGDAAPPEIPRIKANGDAKGGGGRGNGGANEDLREAEALAAAILAKKMQKGELGSQPQQGKGKGAAAAAGGAVPEVPAGGGPPRKRPGAVEEQGAPAAKKKKVVKGGKATVDELDAAQNGRAGRVLGNKAKPLAPGGAGKDEDEKKLKWDGGWSQRFKGKGAAGEAVVDPASPQEALLVPPPASGFLAHPLVERFSTSDFSRRGVGAAKLKADGEMFNITLCALVPSESRFLPEWLLYHRLLGVERFALYDTSAAGAAGAAEIDQGADKMAAEVGGDVGPSVQDLKDGIGHGASGLDENGKVWPERIQSLEEWIDQGVVTHHWMKFKDARKAQGFHDSMMTHCAATYSPTTEWLAHLDVDEFLVLAQSLYGPRTPYETPETGGWSYPLHDILARPTTAEAACIPLPELRYRNFGIRKLAQSQGVLDTQTRRDVVNHGNLPEKTLIHPAFTSDFVDFDGPHSCRVNDATTPPPGVNSEIRNSQGETIQEGGAYKSTRLPTEPLAIAHYLQRDLSDCHQKLSNLDDPASTHEKGRGAVLCEEHYLPSPAELASPSFQADNENRFLLRLPEEGSIVEDARVRDSWAAQAASAILKEWEGRPGASEALIRRATGKVVMLDF